MKISAETLDIIAFASTLDNKITFNSGSYQSQCNTQKDQAMYVELKECIPRTFLLPDLKKLNALLGRLKNAEIDFTHENYISLQEGHRFEYRLETQPHETKEIKEPTPSDKWSWTIEDAFISKKTMSTIFDYARVNGGSSKKNEIKLEFFSQDNCLMGFVGSDLNNRNDGLVIAIGEGNIEGRLQFKVKNLPSIKDDYSVDIASKGIVRFRSDKYKMRYYCTGYVK